MSEEPAATRDLTYVGEELELFELARNWKSYFATRARPYIRGEVLEVGAGLGANIPYLYHEQVTRWLSLEPDASLCDEYRRRQAAGTIPADCELQVATIEDLPREATFDTLLYFDVMEHIEDDHAEMHRALARLRPGGHLIVLCPAHKGLFSKFDAAIGHYRRYDKSMYRHLSPALPVRMEYLDSVGFLASFANKLLLKQSYPTARQIGFWDRVLVRLSRVVDPLTFRWFGKSILGIWTTTSSPDTDKASSAAGGGCP